MSDEELDQAVKDTIETMVCDGLLNETRHPDGRITLSLTEKGARLTQEIEARAKSAGFEIRFFVDPTQRKH